MRFLSGSAARHRLLESLDLVHHAVEYLNAEVQSTETIAMAPTPAGGDWIRCGDLISNASLLASTVRRSGQELGIQRDDVAASLFILGWSYRVMAMSVACLAKAGLIPDSSASHMAVGLSGPWPSLVAYVDPPAQVICDYDGPLDRVLRGQLLDEALEFMTQTAIAGHLQPLVGMLHQTFRVGTRMLWGNVAASSAAVFMEARTALGEWIEALGDRFFEIAPAELSGLGSFLVLEHAGERGWFWERKNCCLWYKVPGAWQNVCNNCCRTPRAERHDSYRAALQAQANGR